MHKDGDHGLDFHGLDAYTLCHPERISLFGMCVCLLNLVPLFLPLLEPVGLRPLQQFLLLIGQHRDRECPPCLPFGNFLVVALEAGVPEWAYPAFVQVKLVDDGFSVVVILVLDSPLGDGEVPFGAAEHVGVLVEGEAVPSVYARAQSRMRRCDERELLLFGEFQDWLPGICRVTKDLFHLQPVVMADVCQQFLARYAVVDLTGGHFGPEYEAAFLIDGQLVLVAEEVGVVGLVPLAHVRVDGIGAVVVVNVIDKLLEPVETALHMLQVEKVRQVLADVLDQPVAVGDFLAQVIDGVILLKGAGQALVRLVDGGTELLAVYLEIGQRAVEVQMRRDVGAVYDDIDMNLARVYVLLQDAALYGHADGLVDESAQQLIVLKAHLAELAQRAGGNGQVLGHHAQKKLVAQVVAHLFHKVDIGQVCEHLQDDILEHAHRVLGQAAIVRTIFRGEHLPDDTEVNLVVETTEEMAGGYQHVVQVRMLRKSDCCNSVYHENFVFLVTKLLKIKLIDKLSAYFFCQKNQMDDKAASVRREAFSTIADGVYLWVVSRRKNAQSRPRRQEKGAESRLCAILQVRLPKIGYFFSGLDVPRPYQCETVWHFILNTPSYHS